MAHYKAWNSSRSAGLIFCVLISLLVGSCGEQKKPDVIHVQYLEIWANNLNQSFEAIVKQWATENHVQVEITRVPLSNLPQRTAEFVQANNGVDVAVMPATDAIVHKNVLLDMTKLMTSEQQTGLRPIPIASAMNTSGGKWVAVPLDSWSHLWTWRKDVVSSAGLSLPNKLTQVPGFLRALKRTKPDMSPFGIGLGSDDDAKMFTQSVLWSFGASVFDASGKRIVLDSPQTVAAYKFVISLYSDGFEPQGVFGWDGASNNRAFLASQIVGTANSPTILYAVNHSGGLPERDIDMTLYPEGPAGRHQFATGFSLVVRKDCPHSAEALSLIKFILKNQNYARFIAAGEGSVNPQYEGFDRLPIWNDPRLRIALQSTTYEHPVGWPGPVTAAAAEIYNRHILTDVYSRVLIDGLTVEAAVSEAAQRASKIAASN